MQSKFAKSFASREKCAMLRIYKICTHSVDIKRIRAAIKMCSWELKICWILCRVKKRSKRNETSRGKQSTSYSTRIKGVTSEEIIWFRNTKEWNFIFLAISTYLWEGNIALKHFAKYLSTFIVQFNRYTIYKRKVLYT